MTKESISDKKYQHAKTVWNTFNMNTLGDFHDLYVLTDTLLLCDVFERIRDMTLKNYELGASFLYQSKTSMVSCITNEWSLFRFNYGSSHVQHD